MSAREAEALRITTWADFQARWRTAMVGLGYSPKTVDSYSDAMKWCAAWCRQRRLRPARVTTAHLLEFMGSRPHWSRSTRALVRSALGAAYRWAVAAEYLDRNPVAALPPGRRQAPAPHPAPDHAYASALRAADDAQRLMLRLAAECGLRRAEVAAVHPQRDLVEEPGGWSLWVHGKGSKDRLVPLPADLARELRLAGPGWLFPGRTDGHLAPNTVGVAISRLLPDGVSMHALRHRFATRAYNATHDLFAVQQLLGHTSPATTQVYVALDQSAKRRVMEAGLMADGAPVGGAGTPSADPGVVPMHARLRAAR